MKKRPLKETTEMSVQSVHGQPQDAEELIRKYGTYNIQPTAESENRYPTIAHGLPRKAGNFTDTDPEEFAPVPISADEDFPASKR